MEGVFVMTTKEQIIELAQYTWPSDRKMWSVDGYLPKLETFYHAAIQQYKDSILAEVGEPVAIVGGGETYWDIETVEGTQDPGNNTKLYTESQLLAATKKLEDKVQEQAAEIEGWRQGQKEDLALQVDLHQQLTAEQDKVKVLVDALNNCRLLAARYRKEEWAGHVFRYCHTAGVTASALRDAEREALSSIQEGK
jgi:hypothetical protein